MTDRDLQIGGLLAQVESLRKQNSDQFQRIDSLEVSVAQNAERIAALRERIQAVSAADAPAARFPAWVSDRKTWVVAGAAVGIAAGWWNLADIRTLLVPVP